MDIEIDNLFNDELLSGIKILYVEDEEAIRASLSRILSRRIQSLETAENGKVGLQKFIEFEPDIVITDIRMPVMDGLSMIEEIRKISVDVPVVITTGHNDEFFLLRSIDLGVDKYVKKPVNASVLLNALASIVENLKRKREMIFKNNFIKILLDMQVSYLAIVNKTKVTYMNKPFLKLFDISKDNEGFYKFLESNKNFNTEEEFIAWATSRKEDSENTVRMVIPKTGLVHTFMFSVVQIPASDAEYLLTFTDVTQLENEKLFYQFLSEYDGLTKIYNRSKLTSELEKVIKKSNEDNTPLCILMLDVDKFKLVNDNYGHHVGDIVLIEFAQIIQTKIESTDIFGRYGGEEFLVVLPDIDINSAVSVAKRICHFVEKHEFPKAGRVTCSIGVAEYKKGESLVDFVKHSDEAMYQAKRNGRNRVEVYK